MISLVKGKTELSYFLFVYGERYRNRVNHFGRPLNIDLPRETSKNDPIA